MIVVQDRIEVAGHELDRLQQLFRDKYMAAATDRGLQFIESLVSPPLQLRSAPITLWLRWQVADAGAWWAMRAQSGDPAVGRFWAEVDTLCVARERTYLTADSAADLPLAADVSRFTINTRGHRETAQLALRDNACGEDDRSVLAAILRSAADEIKGLEVLSLGANFAPEYAAGHYTWDLLYPDRAIAETAQQTPFWKNTIKKALDQYCVACHALGLETIGAGLRRPGLADAIKRTAYFRMLPGTSPEVAGRFERDLLEMPGQIPQIQNWRLSRARTLSWDTANSIPWTYVWEQEYESLDDLLGPYMVHPHHWAHIDRWFDPESGVQAVDVKLSHAFCALDQSIITRELQ
jgi:mono/diheme cytochrome c family protein